MTTQGETHGICHHPRKPGGFVAATLWQRHKAKALVIVHPATAVVQGFYKGFAEYLYKRGLVSLLMITGALVFRSPGESVTTKHHVRLDRAGRRMHHRVGESPSPGLTLLAIGHSIGGHAVLLSSASTDLRAAVMVASHAGVTSTISQTKEKLQYGAYCAHFAGSLVYASQTSRAG